MGGIEIVLEAIGLFMGVDIIETYKTKKCYLCLENGPFYKWWIKPSLYYFSDLLNCLANIS